MTMPSDPIAQVQALVGCPHNWCPTTGTKAGMLYKCNECADEFECTLKLGLPDPAPDCATTDGALQAATRLLADTAYMIAIDTVRFAYLYKAGDCIVDISMGDECTELERARAVCELILQALEEK